LWERLSAAMDEVDRFRMERTPIYRSETHKANLESKTRNLQPATRNPDEPGLNIEECKLNIRI